MAAADLFEDYLTTAVGPGEILTEVRLPALDGYGYGYAKFTRRREDWAMVGVCALVKKGADGTCEDVRIGLTHMGSTPLRATAAEEALRGQPLDADTIAAAAEQAAEGTNPPADLNASADYKRHLARVMCRRALRGRVILSRALRHDRRRTRGLAGERYLADRALGDRRLPRRRRSSSRCCSRARRASARPRWRGRWRPPPARA